jgi:peptidyl-prolyl cis-trans isomerase SDCCAG10
MIQTGDPTNTGSGGESIYSSEFRDEFHSRLKFNHRGVVAMNNKNKPNSNGSQFFITLEKCEEMNKKFTIFGKVTGPTFFNAINISNLSADEDGKPLMNNEKEIPKIINTEVVINPFKDLKPTVDLTQLIKNENEENIGDNNDNDINKKKKKKLKIKNITDKMFFNIDEN